MNNRGRQIPVCLILLALNALSAFVSYTFFSEQLAIAAGVPLPEMELPPIVFGFANAGIVVILFWTDVLWHVLLSL